MSIVGFLKKAVLRVVKQWLAPIMPLVLVSVLIGIGVALLARAAGYVAAVPPIVVPGGGWEIGSTAVVFVGVTLCCLFVGGCILLVRTYDAALAAYWDTYSAWAQAVILGCLFATLVAVSLAAAALWEQAPAYSVLLGFLVTWPLAAGFVLLVDRRSYWGSSSTFSSVKTGYVHTRGLESRTLSLIVGFLSAIACGLALWYAWAWYAADPSFAATAVVTVLCWIGVTLLVYNRYDTSAVERTDISIVAVRTPDSRPARELTIKNESSTSVDLSQSRIRDTAFELYRLGVAVTLRPGAVCTFEIPDSFTLEPNDDSIELPLGYSLKRGGETPTLLTKSGDIYALRRATDVAAPDDRTGTSDSADGADADREPGSGTDLVPTE